MIKKQTNNKFHSSKIWESDNIDSTIFDLMEIISIIISIFTIKFNTNFF